MYLIDAVDKALRAKRHFDDWVLRPAPPNFAALLKVLPDLFRRIDDALWNGALFRCMEEQHIVFRIRTSTSGPAGLTTFDMHAGMQLFLNRNAWVKAFPAMVGGTLCSSADLCLAKIFAHEMVHVLLFTIYHTLNMSHEDICAIPTDHDLHHNVLFVRWLKCFFNQDTIDNSLLLHMSRSKEPLTFARPVHETENTCLRNADTELEVLYKGQWQKAQFLDDQGHHQSLVAVPSARRRLLVPNGLLRC